MQEKIALLKLIDLWLISPLVFFIGLIPARRGSSGRFPENARCLIIRPGGIGDAVSLLPAINFLKESHSGWKIDVLAERRNGDVFKACASIHRIYLYDRGFELLKCVSKRYDVAVDTEQWHRFSAIVAIFCAPFTTGFATNMRRRLFSVACPYSLDEYEVESFMRLMEGVGVAGRCGKRSFSTPPFLNVEGRCPPSVGKKIGRLQGDKRVCVSVGGSIPEKIWETGCFILLINRLFEKGVSVILVGGEGDKPISRAVRKGLKFPGNPDDVFLELTGVTTLLETAAVIAKSDLLLCGDTGILHVGAATGVPTLSLFGPGNWRKWAPRGGRHKHLTGDAPCSPCSRYGYTPKCKNEGRCMGSIIVEDVESALYSLLATL